MLFIQLSCFLVSFFIPTAQPQLENTLSPAYHLTCTPCDLLCLTATLHPEMAIHQLSQSQLTFDDNIENENCFHDLNETLVLTALEDVSAKPYVILDTLAKISDGYVGEVLSVSLGQLFQEDTADFLDYYLSVSSTDFQFLFLSELEISCGMQSEAEVDLLKEGWISLLSSFHASPMQSKSFEQLKNQIQNL